MEKHDIRQPKPTDVKRPVDAKQANGTSSTVRLASDEQFQRAHRKTSKLHGGLFRRLSQ